MHNLVLANLYFFTFLCFSMPAKSEEVKETEGSSKSKNWRITTSSYFTSESLKKGKNPSPKKLGKYSVFFIAEDKWDLGLSYLEANYTDPRTSFELGKFEPKTRYGDLKSVSLIANRNLLKFLKGGIGLAYSQFDGVPGYVHSKYYKTESIGVDLSLATYFNIKLTEVLEIVLGVDWFTYQLPVWGKGKKIRDIEDNNYHPQPQPTAKESSKEFSWFDPSLTFGISF